MSRSAEEILAELGEKKLRADANKVARMKDVTMVIEVVADCVKEIIHPLEVRIAELEADRQRGREE